MSEPAEDGAPSPPDAPPAARMSTASRRDRAPAVIIAASVVVVVIGAVASAPLWAPTVIHHLPWGGAEKPAASDPAVVALRTEASRITATLEHLSQRVAALETRSAPDVPGLQHRIAALEAKPPPDLSPIQQQLGALDQKLAALGKQVAEQPAVDPTGAALALVLLQIRDAVETGRPFDAEYQALLALTRDHPEIAANVAPLAAPAQSGVASRAVLTERLRELAPQIATARPPPKSTWKSQIVARLRSLVTIRRIDGDEQKPAEKAVTTAQRALAVGDLAAAVAALDALSGPGKTAAEPWLQMAKARLSVEIALRQTQAALAAALGSTRPVAKGG
jgi:hypothetical protein